MEIVLVELRDVACDLMKKMFAKITASIFLGGVVHRVENGWGLTKVAAVLLNGLLW